MKDHPANNPNPPGNHQRGVYREFLAEREEILRHKWLRSEVRGGDIGFDSALIEWVQRHRSDWRRSRNGAA